MKSENNELSLIKQLRELTQAGMKDCKDSLTEAIWDLQKAVDLVKKKGLNVVSGREGKVAAEGIIAIVGAEFNARSSSMIEINCQTDFVSNNDAFKAFAVKAAMHLAKQNHNDGLGTFDPNDLEEDRKALVSTTKENVIIRRWHVENTNSNTRVFSYIHSNKKIGVLLTLFSLGKISEDEVTELGNDLTMQVAAMNPIAVKSNRLPEAVVTRQLAIFEEQLKELNKPQAAWSKIIDGKSRKWHTEVCLLDQESITVPKSSVRQVIKNISDKLGCEITVLNFVRFEVGEGIEVSKSNLADEVSQMSGVHQHSRQGMSGACKDCPKD